jgi:hypothetical protein
MKMLLMTALMLTGASASAFASGTGGTTQTLPIELEELIASGIPEVDPCPAVGECPEPFGSIKSLEN